MSDLETNALKDGKGETISSGESEFGFNKFFLPILVIYI